MYFRINVVVEPATNKNNTLKDEEQVVYLGDNVPVALKQNQRRKTNSENKGKVAKNEDANDGKCNLLNWK